MKKLSHLPPHSKLWIYQSNRELADSEVAEINLKSNHFISQWNAHGSALDAAVEVFYNRFIVVAVDEQKAMASGCSIDKSLDFIKMLESDYDIILLDRMSVAYKKDDKIYSCKLSELKSLFSEKIMDENTMVFNNLVATKKEFDEQWEVPLKDSWQQRYV